MSFVHKIVVFFVSNESEDDEGNESEDDCEFDAIAEEQRVHDIIAFL